MFCPKCHEQPMLNKQVGTSGISIDVCPKCSGVWFDGGELESLLEVASSNLKVPAGAGRSDKICPHCHETMSAFYYPQTFVAIDMCKQCRGLWLDQGELKEVKQVREYLARSGMVTDDTGGVKQVLLNFIDGAIEALSLF